MEHLIEVAFKGNRREFFRWSFEAPPPVKAAIIVETERGEDLGRVHATGELAERRKAGTTHGKEQREPLRAALRLASGDDVARADAHREEEEVARRAAVAKARALNLQMKVSDAEWQWDRRRLTFYFTAEERVDFRSLVRQLETQFGARVQMWHIGPRDEAKRLDGVGHCGRQLCSASWLPELLPVKTSLAKDQRLSTITPTQISGACGRLMCCLRYEHDFYVAARKRFPKQGKIVTTLQGEEKIDNTDIFRDLVTLRNPAGETRVISLSQFKKELAGETIPVDDEPHEGDDDAHDEPVREDRARPERPARPLAQLQRSQPSRDASRESGREGGREGGRDTARERPRDGGGRDALRPPREPREPREPRDARRGQPAPATGAPAAPVVAQPTATPSPAPEDIIDAALDAAAGPEGEQRRGRRRRGRRGGRRHRGDGNSQGGAPGGNGGIPPQSPTG